MDGFGVFMEGMARFGWGALREEKKARGPVGGEMELYFYFFCSTFFFQPIFFPHLRNLIPFRSRAPSIAFSPFLSSQGDIFEPLKEGCGRDIHPASRGEGNGERKNGGGFGRYVFCLSNPIFWESEKNLGEARERGIEIWCLDHFGGKNKGKVSFWGRVEGFCFVFFCRFSNTDVFCKSHLFPSRKHFFFGFFFLPPLFTPFSPHFSHHFPSLFPFPHTPTPFHSLPFLPFPNSLFQPRKRGTLISNSPPFPLLIPIAIVRVFWG